MLCLNIRMDPYQQYPSSPQGNPYEFILNPAKPPKKKTFGLGGNNLLKVAVIIIVTAIGVMILLTVLLNALAPKKLSADELKSVAQSQAELLRVAGQATASSVQQNTKNLATTIELTMSTQEHQTIALLKANGVKMGAKELALKQDATSDQKLAAAKTTSTYDQTYITIAQASLTSYANYLKQLTTKTNSQSERDRMSEYNRQVQLLISQIPYTQNTIDSAGTPQANQ